MGPKKKGKAPKKTKEELEEERRLQEEEEARLRAEEEKRVEEERVRRELEAARRREEDAKNRAAELARLAQEHSDAKHELEAKAARLAELLRGQKEAKDWDKYLACEPRPDAQVEGDMNSFLNSWQLDTEALELELPAVTAACESATAVMEDLAFVAANARATNDDALHAQCSRFVTRLQELVADKADVATAHVLQFADEYADAAASATPAVSVVGSSNANASATRGEVKLASKSPSTGWVQLGLWVNLLAKGSSRNKRVDFADLGVSVDLPKAVITQSLALRVTRWPFDAFSASSVCADVALGGVFSLELLAVPAPPKRARGWVMREVPDAREQLKRLHYPLDGMVVSAALPIKASLSLPHDVLFAPTPLGGGSAQDGALRVGWWDATHARWEQDGVTDVVYSPESNSVSFSTLRLTHLALLARRTRNFHKRSWRLRMDTAGPAAASAQARSDSLDHGGMSAQLTLSTALFPRVQLEITPQGARLVAPALAQLEALRQTALPPGELLTRLARAGIDLCPPPDPELDATGAGTKEDDDLKRQPRLGFVPKLKALEDRVLDEIASVVAAYEVSDGNGDAEWGRGTGAAASRWPGALGNAQQIVFSVKEMTWPYLSASMAETSGAGVEMQQREVRAGDERDGEDVESATSADSVLVLAQVDDEAAGGCVKFRLDRRVDGDQRAQAAHEAGHEDEDEDEDVYDTHVHLRQALEAISSPDARDRMDNSHVLFELMLQKTLRLLRLLSYSQPPLLPAGRKALEQPKEAKETPEDATSTSAASTSDAPVATEDNTGASPPEEPQEPVVVDSDVAEEGGKEGEAAVS